jgi:hypothetical protein
MRNRVRDRDFSEAGSARANAGSVIRSFSKSAYDRSDFVAAKTATYDFSPMIFLKPVKNHGGKIIKETRGQRVNQNIRDAKIGTPTHPNHRCSIDAGAGLRSEIRKPCSALSGTE